MLQNLSDFNYIVMQNFNFTDELKKKNNGIFIKLSVYVFKEDNAYISYCPSLDLSGCGNDINEAKDSMEKTLMIYFDYALNKNTLLKDLRNHGWNVRGVKQKKIKAPKFDELLHNEDFLDILENKEYQKFDTPVEIPV